MRSGRGRVKTIHSASQPTPEFLGCGAKYGGPCSPEENNIASEKQNVQKPSGKRFFEEKTKKPM